MYKTLNIHNQKGSIIKITFWRFPKSGGANSEDISTDCGYVAITQEEGFKVTDVSVGFEGALQTDVNIEPASRRYITELKNYPDSDPPFKCLTIEMSRD